MPPRRLTTSPFLNALVANTPTSMNVLGSRRSLAATGGGIGRLLDRPRGFL